MGIEMLALRRDPLHACVRLPAWGSAESINGPTDSLGTRGMDTQAEVADINISLKYFHIFLCTLFMPSWKMCRHE